MRYRALSSTGDYTFGQSAANFLVDSTGDPVALAQSILTRLKLLQGEWFVNILSGVPYATFVLGKGTKPYYDQVIKSVILLTAGVTQINSYSSVLAHRSLSINAVVSTIYGPITIITPLSVSP
jgi:hypothetical protein